VTRPPLEELAAAGLPIHYTAPEAAAILDPTGKTTGYWLLTRARSGLFPCTKVGRSTVFSPANLAEIARSLNKPSRPAAVQVPRSGGRGKAAGAGTASRPQAGTSRRRKPAA